MKRWQPYVLIPVAILAIVATTWWFRSALGDPSAAELRDAVARVAGDDCPSAIGVMSIKNIGGPGLPSGMWHAREVVCAADVAAAQPEIAETRHPTLAIQYVFVTGSALRDWLGDAQPSDDHLRRGATLVFPGSDMSEAEWKRVRAMLDSPG